MSSYLYLKGDKMDLTATPKSIDDTFRLHRKYVIPRFQREYSWELDELSEMYDDLIDNIVYSNDELKTSDYFIGSLVLVGDDDDTSKIERLVVDGQQRLMTFTIAFSVLSQKFLEIGEKKLSDKTHLNVMGEDNDGNTYAKVVNENPKPFFQARIQKKEIDFTAIPQSLEEKRILYAYNYFDRMLKETMLVKSMRANNPGMGEIKYIDALKAFRDQILKCKVIYVTVKSLDDAYNIFEVLNAKGKDLTPIDMIKNSIFSILTDEEPLDFAAEKWKSIKNSIKQCENVDFNIFYRHYWLSKYCLSTSKKLVANFNKYIPKTIADYTAFLSCLDIAAERYAKIVTPTKNDWVQPEDLFVYTTLKAFDIFNVTQVRIFLLALFEVKDKKIISHKNFKKILLYLEHFHLIFTAICSRRPSGLERRYSAYARMLRNCSDKTESSDCINNLIADLDSTLPDFQEFKNCFMNVAYVSNKEKDKKLAQYILQKLETYFASNELVPNSFTIEHILPESVGLYEAGMIGNLLPLGEKLNNALEDRDFQYKVTRYPESQYASVKKFIEQYGGLDKWSKDNIIERTEKLSEILYYNIIEG